MRSAHVEQRIAETDPDSVKAALESLLRQRSIELKEHQLVLDILVAAGLVGREKIEQAHEIVRGFRS